jgi:hypothetical protein
VDKLTAGSYRLQLVGLDSAGHGTPMRTADFDVE